jgi:hypothetical protein
MAPENPLSEAPWQVEPCQEDLFVPLQEEDQLSHVDQSFQLVTSQIIWVPSAAQPLSSVEHLSLWTLKEIVCLLEAQHWSFDVRQQQLSQLLYSAAGLSLGCSTGMNQTPSVWLAVAQEPLVSQEHCSLLIFIRRMFPAKLKFQMNNSCNTRLLNKEVVIKQELTILCLTRSGQYDLSSLTANFQIMFEFLVEGNTERACEQWQHKQKKKHGPSC